MGFYTSPRSYVGIMSVGGTSSGGVRGMTGSCAPSVWSAGTSCAPSVWSAGTLGEHPFAEHGTAFTRAWDVVEEKPSDKVPGGFDIVLEKRDPPKRKSPIQEHKWGVAPPGFREDPRKK